MLARSLTTLKTRAQGRFDPSSSEVLGLGMIWHQLVLGGKGPDSSPKTRVDGEPPNTLLNIARVCVDSVRHLQAGPPRHSGLVDIGRSSGDDLFERYRRGEYPPVAVVVIW